MKMPPLALKVCCAFLFLVFFDLQQHACRAADQPQGLPQELKGLAVQEEFVRAEGPDVGLITALAGKGKLVVHHLKAQSAYYGQKGNPVFKEDALYTLKDARCRLEFKDKSVAMMAPESRLVIGEIVVSALKGEKSAWFELAKGKAIFYVLPLLGYRDSKLEVKTPTALVGVRGTKFGVEMTRRSLGGAEDVSRIYVVEGLVEVTSLIDGKSQRLRKNEILEVDRRGLGAVQYDPEKIKSFVQEVTEGIASAEPSRLSPGREILEQRYQSEELERLDRMEDVKQRENIQPVTPSSPVSPSPVIPHPPSSMPHSY